MKVLFLIKSSYTPSSRLRVTDLEHILRANGVEPTIEIIPTSSRARRALFEKASAFPVVVLQKRLLKWWDFSKLRAKSRFLVFDFDDAIYLRNASPATNPMAYESATRRRLFKRVVNNVDLVIASTKVLANKTRHFSKTVPIEIVPSSVKQDEIEPREHNRFDGCPVIGWTGTTSTFRYLEYIMPSLIEIQKESGCLYRFMANAAPEFKDIEFEFVQWEEDKEYPAIRTFDIGVMPLSEDPFSIGKASYKLLQYLCLGVPAVCSPVGMNADVAGDDEFALCAERPEDFAPKLRMLLESQKLREELAVKGKKLITEKYARNTVGVQLAKVLTTIPEN